MHRIAVQPLSLGPDHFGNPEILCAFYSLGCLVAYAKTERDGELAERFDFGRVTPTLRSAADEQIGALTDAPSVFLLSSYVWNHDVNMVIAAAIKQRSPGSLVVVGGPHIPRAPEPARRFFETHPCVDVAARQEGEVTVAEILHVIAATPGAADDLRRVDLSRIAGLTLRRDGAVVRTQDRERRKDLTAFPSPYTSGEFDHWIEGCGYIAIETNRGCPYGCTFCDWGAATLSKIHSMSMERVLSDIEFAGRRRIQSLGLCDANFGILPRDLEIARHIAWTRERFGFPREINYSSAKTAHPRLGEIIKILRSAGFAAAAPISMQTTDEQVLANVERANIKTAEYRKMIAFLHREGIPAVSDMMVGLPGQTFATCQKDLQFFFDHKVLAVIFAASVMPNAPMADEDYRARFQITIGADGMVDSTYSFTPDEYARMFELCLAYKLFVKVGLLKYLLYFLQTVHGVPALEVIARWLAVVSTHPERYPLSSRVRDDLMRRDYQGGRKDWLVLAWRDEDARFLFEDFDAFQREIVDFVSREHGVAVTGTDLDAVLVANRAVLPQKGRVRPTRVSLAHDVVGYFADLRRLPSLETLPPDLAPLARRGPGVLEVAAPAPGADYAYLDLGLTAGTFELPSDLRI